MSVGGKVKSAVYPGWRLPSDSDGGDGDGQGSRFWPEADNLPVSAPQAEKKSEP